MVGSSPLPIPKLGRLASGPSQPCRMPAGEHCGESPLALKPDLFPSASRVSLTLGGLFNICHRGWADVSEPWWECLLPIAQPRPWVTLAPCRELHHKPHHQQKHPPSPMPVDHPVCQPRSLLAPPGGRQRNYRLHSGCDPANTVAQEPLWLPSCASLGWHLTPGLSFPTCKMGMSNNAHGSSTCAS